MLWTACALFFTACEEADVLEDPIGEASSKPVVTVGNGNRIFITSNTTWTKDNIYLIDGEVIVQDAVLTIESSTIIKGKKDPTPADFDILNSALIIDTDAQLFALGNSCHPIVFTSDQPVGSRNPGDWGGVIVLGTDVINQGTAQIEGLTNPLTFGGSGDTRPQGSGVLEFVRIEFAGTTLQDGNETNSLTLAGVGANTTVNHIQVSRGNDDGFQFFGGSVNGKFLVSWQTRDDDFDTDFGHTGVVQYAVSRRKNDFVSTESNGIETDNDGSGSNASPETNTIFSNITFIGPGELKGDGTEIDLTTPGVFNAALLIRRNSATSLLNSIITGWPVGTNMRDISTAENFVLPPNDLKLEGISTGLPLNGGTSIRTDAMPQIASDLVIDRFVMLGNNTLAQASMACHLSCIVGLKDAAFATGLPTPHGTNPSGTPDFTLTAGTANLINGQTLPASYISRGLIQESFRGAFDEDDMVTGGNWYLHDGWLEFDPQGALYH